MNKVLVIIFFALVFETTLASSCPEVLKSSREALVCIVKNHPELKVLETRATEFEARKSLASQLPNPELDAKTNLSGEKKVEIDLVQKLELGGKRSARIEVAKSENETISAEDEITRVQILTDSIEALARLHHLREQEQILIETTSAIEKITSVLKRKVALPPDQKASLRLFTLYLGTIDFKKMELEKDIQKVTKAIEFSIGRPIKASDKLGLAPLDKWPKFDVLNIENLLEIRLAKAQQKFAQAESSLANSESWPDFKIGPSYEHESESKETSWGIKAGVTIPLWNQNQGGRNLAQAKLNAKKLTTEAIKKRIQQDFEILRASYHKVVQKLEKNLKSELIVNSIKESESSFSRGLIPPTSLIETYRSSMELVEQTHHAELSAWQMWVRLQYLTNSSSVELP
tara:strand:- start:53500 stop:54705 length:1206 start_codon:yes stop_codon:yes gene_type:complete